MIKRMKRYTAIAAAAVCLLLVPETVYGATRPIGSVSMTVNSDLQPESGLPEIEIGSEKAGDGGVAVRSGSSNYEVTKAEWVDKGSTTLKAADEPRMKVTLTPTDVGEYYFQASYKGSSVKISGGTFVSARRDGDALVVTLRVKPVRGDFEPPLDAFWHEGNMGEARWEKPDNTSGYYEVQLYRNQKSVHKVSETKSLQYNFYPYMTDEGIYTFKVRTIPNTDVEKKYGGKSDWIESGELKITDRYVSDGKGQQKGDSSVVDRNTKPVGWVKDKENNTWSYRFPDGRQCREKWEYIDGQWYYFDAQAIMLTGWQKMNDRHYYLYPDGQMAVGWAMIDGKWYYFLTKEEEWGPAGVMAGGGWRVIGPYYYYFNGDGSLYTGWLDEGGGRYYLNTVDNSLLGAMFTGWIKRDDKTYFADTNGRIAEGWCRIEENWYYFHPGSGELAVNTTIDGFYVDNDGIWR